MPGGGDKRKINVGDEYDVPVVVTRYVPMKEKPYRIEVRGTNGLSDWVCGATLEASRLVKGAPEPLKVGDRVKMKKEYPDRRLMTILAIHEGKVWVLPDEGLPGTWDLFKFERT